MNFVCDPIFNIAQTHNVYLIDITGKVIHHPPEYHHHVQCQYPLQQVQQLPPQQSFQVQQQFLQLAPNQHQIHHQQVEFVRPCPPVHLSTLNKSSLFNTFIINRSSCTHNCPTFISNASYNNSILNNTPPVASLQLACMCNLHTFYRDGSSPHCMTKGTSTCEH